MSLLERILATLLRRPDLSSGLAVGRAGEAAAAKHLQSLGYRILNRNWTCPAGELDLVCAKDNTIVFVEVKSRLSNAAAEPEDNITPAKRRKLTALARAWLDTRGKPDFACRFDAVSVVFTDGSPSLNHIEEAFIPKFDYR